MSETHTRTALPGTGRPVTDRAWVRWAVAAAVTGMLSWVAGVALIPLDAKLDKGNQHLAQVLRAHVAQGYAAALLAVLGAVLLAGFFAVLTRLVPPGHPGWGLLRVSLAGCVITQTLVAVGASSALAGVHAAAGTADAGLIAFGWRGLWHRRHGRIQAAPPRSRGYRRPAVLTKPDQPPCTTQRRFTRASPHRSGRPSGRPAIPCPHRHAGAQNSPIWTASVMTGLEPAAAHNGGSGVPETEPSGSASVRLHS
jgi:hypothetical protein